MKEYFGLGIRYTGIASSMDSKGTIFQIRIKCIFRKVVLDEKNGFVDIKDRCEQFP